MKNKSLILISLLAFSFILTGCDILNTSISETITSSEDVTSVTSSIEITSSEISSTSSSSDEETYYTVTFNPNNGEPTFTQEVVENEKATKPSDPVKEGHVFDGWFTNADELWVFEGYQVTEDMTLTAKYSFESSGTDGLGFTNLTVDGKSFYSVTSYTGDEKNVIIPNYYQGKKVVSIGDNAFKDKYFIKSIELTDNIINIGNYAFTYCIYLYSITIPSSVTSIGNYAFYDCPSLTIYAEAPSKPTGWNAGWNPNNRPVVWGYTG